MFKNAAIFNHILVAVGLYILNIALLEIDTEFNFTYMYIQKMKTENCYEILENLNNTKKYLVCIDIKKAVES